MRDDQLDTMTKKMLARLNAPRAVQNNGQAMKDEVEFLCKKVRQLAPTRNYTEWFDTFEEQVLTNLETRSWPTVKEISKAAKEIAPKRPEFKDLTGEAEWKPDPLKINAKRIKAGEGVDEKYIFGKLGEQLISLGLVTEEETYPYREAMAYRKKP